jgi:hypothetical protein
LALHQSLPYNWLLGYRQSGDRLMIKQRFICFCRLVAAILLVVFAYAIELRATLGADESGLAEQNTAIRAPEEAKALVNQLGDDQFSVREGATNQLIQRGVDAKPILLAASNSQDAEIKIRSRRILSIIVDADYQRRRAAFQADHDGSANTSLPGWEIFKEKVGSDEIARNLFLQLQDAETALFEAYEQGPDKALEVLKERSQKAWDRAQPMGRRGVRPAANVGLANAAALLFIGSDPRIELTDEIATRLTALPGSEALRNAILSGDERARKLYRTLVGRWIARDMSLELLAENLAFASNYGIKEALPPAIETLKSNEPTTAENSRLRTVAMLLICKLGGREQVRYLEPYYNDSALCLPQPVQVQMRDLALWVSLRLYSKDAREFGFERAQPNDSTGVNLNTIAFKTEDDRQVAFKKWDDARKKLR